MVAWRALEEASQSDRQLQLRRGLISAGNWKASKITYLQRVARLECTPNEYGGEGHHVTTRWCSVSDGDKIVTERRTSIRS